MPAIIQTMNNFTEDFFFKTQKGALDKCDLERENCHWSRVEAFKVSKNKYRVVCWSWNIN